MPILDDGSTHAGKKEKKGFKVERAARFHERHRKEMNKLRGKTNERQTTKNPELNPLVQRTSRVKSVSFDDANREEYLTTLHKKKNERRAQAMFDARRRMIRENSKFRRESREEARRQFNSYAQVPILPDYSFRFPTLAEDEMPEEEEEGDEDAAVASGSSVSSANAVSAGEDSEVDFGGQAPPSASDGDSSSDDSSSTDESSEDDGSVSGAEVGEAAADAVAGGKRETRAVENAGRKVLASIGSASRKRIAFRENLGGSSTHATGDYESVTVDVRPLRDVSTSQGPSLAALRQAADADKSTRGGRRGKQPDEPKRRSRGGLDFSDLDPAVAAILEARRKKEKGAAQPRGKMHVVREMQKYHKIMKHSRKK